MEEMEEHRIGRIQGLATIVGRLGTLEVSKGQFAHIAYTSEEQVLSGSRNVLMFDEELGKYEIF